MYLVYITLCSEFSDPMYAGNTNGMIKIAIKLLAGAVA